jgi:catechol 2,3-dioxygenase-like lactoylglutathione lyase family enzyme
MNTSAPLANLITLGARDLPAQRNFYRALGWPQITDDGEFVAFEQGDAQSRFRRS